MIKFKLVHQRNHHGHANKYALNSQQSHLIQLRKSSKRMSDWIINYYKVNKAHQSSGLNTRLPDGRVINQYGKVLR